MNQDGTGKTGGTRPGRTLLLMVAALGIGFGLGATLRTPVPGAAEVRSQLDEIRRRPPSPLLPLPVPRPTEVPILHMARDPFAAPAD